MCLFVIFATSLECSGTTIAMETPNRTWTSVFSLGSINHRLIIDDIVLVHLDLKFLHLFPNLQHQQQQQRQGSRKIEARTSFPIVFLTKGIRKQPSPFICSFLARIKSHIWCQAHRAAILSQYKNRSLLKEAPWSSSNILRGKTKQTTS